LFRGIWKDRRSLSKIELIERQRKELHVPDRKERSKEEKKKSRQVKFVSLRKKDR
jgi:hypothetical protein